MNLYEINSAYEDALMRAMESAEDNGGAIDDEIATELEQLEITLSEKIENTACYIKNIEAEAEAIKAEEKRLADRRKSLERKAGSIREWLQMNLHGEKYNSARVAISYHKSEAIEIESGFEPIDLPQEFQRSKTTVEIDKTAIKSALKAGAIIEGAFIVKREIMVIK